MKTFLIIFAVVAAINAASFLYFSWRYWMRDRVNRRLRDGADH